MKSWVEEGLLSTECNAKSYFALLFAGPFRESHQTNSRILLHFREFSVLALWVPTSLLPSPPCLSSKTPPPQLSNLESTVSFFLPWNPLHLFFSTSCLIYSLHLWVCFLWVLLLLLSCFRFHMWERSCGIYLSDWLLSLSVTPWRSTHVVTNGTISLLL